MNVTPCVGVWIEIPLDNRYAELFKSLPAWECGLKLKYQPCIEQFVYVTPCVGVWIEILDPAYGILNICVTPCVGVWIEILNNEVIYEAYLVTPCVGVWIEIILLVVCL